MKIRHLCWVLFAVSFMANIYFLAFYEAEGEIEQVIEETESLYPENFSSFDQNISFEFEHPVYSGYTLEGDETEFLSFRLEGTIINSVKKKYDRTINRELVRNIQEIVYFVNNFKVSFSGGDKISLIYRKKDFKIVFLSFKSAMKRSASEIFLFNSNGEERYITSSREYLQPCITNGPFDRCPQVTFANDGKVLVPVFNTGFGEKIKLPFLAKLISVSESYSKGGEMVFVYSNFATKAVFKGLARVDTSLRKNALYNEGVQIGESGFSVNSSQKGIIYYLKKGENRVISPFSFHHTEAMQLDEKQLVNVEITISYFRAQFKSGKMFEKDYY